MPDKVFPGRYTAHAGEPFVVFLIGMRINQFFAFNKWLPAFNAMPRMLRELHQHPDKGFLGAEYFYTLLPLNVMLMSYWRSFDDLEKFARSADDPHLSAWKQFNQTVGVDGSVGIWHETYQVNAGAFESVYNNMPRWGLAAATQHVPAVGRRETARRRLGGNNEPAVPTPETGHA